MVRVHATTAAGRFSRGPLRLGPSWQAVDATVPEVRKVLVDGVGVHIRVHPDDTAKLAELGLAVTGGRLSDRWITVGEPAAPSAPSAPPAPPAVDEQEMPLAAEEAPRRAASSARRHARA